MTDLPACYVPFDPARWEAATPVFLVRRGDVPGGADASMIARGRFEGAVGEVQVQPGCVLVGTGDGSEPLALGAAAAALGEGDYRVDGATPMDLLAWGLGAYRFDRYKKTAATPTLVLAEDADGARLSREVGAARLARDMVNTPAEEMGPDEIAAEAQALAARYGGRVEVTRGQALEKGFPLVHAVGRAAATPPCVVDLRWGSDGPAVTILGKGVCFDSGGLNVKSGKSMGLMKKDMGGAANALALALMVMDAQLPIRLRVLIPAVENAIAGNAFRPGDVFHARDGQTVEISNTDAEGRLILADALALAAEEAPDRIVSLATLTGAARVALGPDLPPIYSTDEAFSDAVVEAGRAAADPVWPMPFWDRYAEFLSSPIADVNHAADTPFAGSITAALFLRRFVGEVPYTHLDIYAWVPKARPGRPLGGELMGPRALFGALGG